MPVVTSLMVVKPLAQEPEHVRVSGAPLQQPHDACSQGPWGRQQPHRHFCPSSPVPCLLSCRAAGCQGTPSSTPPNPAPPRVKLRNNETEPLRRTSRRGKRNKFYLRPKHLARKTEKEREQGSGEKKKDIKKERQRKHSNPFPFRNCQVTLTEVTEYPQKPSLLHQHGPYGVDGAGCGVRSSAWDPPQSLGAEAPGKQHIVEGAGEKAPMRVTQHSGQGLRGPGTGVPPDNLVFSWSSTH